jgi:hypothetical protein
MSFSNLLFRNINRCALIVNYKQSYLDYLKGVDETLEVDLNSEMLEPNVYLIPDFETKVEGFEWLSKNYQEIFTEELALWYADEALWPENLSFDLFNKFFKFEILVMIYDTQKKSIKKM